MKFGPACHLFAADDLSGAALVRGLKPFFSDNIVEDFGKLTLGDSVTKSGANLARARRSIGFGQNGP